MKNEEQEVDMRRMAAGILTLGLLCAASPAWARTRAHDLAESPYYKEKVGGMLGRGVINAVTFFVDFLVNTVNETKQGPPLIGTLTGMAQGIGCSALRLGSGAVDLTTFWVPGFNGFPVSDSYENCLASVSPAAASAPARYEAPAPYASPVVQPLPAPPKKHKK